MKRILSFVLIAVLLVSLAGCGSSKCTSVVLNTGDVSLSQPGQTKGLTVTKEPAGATDKVSFRSSDSSVAVVDEYGLITAVGAGNATITVTCGDAVAFCEVVVGSGGANDSVQNTTPPAQGSVTPDTVTPDPVTVDCPDCGGRGGYTCNSCGGAYQCNDCGGSGVDANAAVDCSLCGGDGMCSACGGDGKFGSGRKCGTCNGSGDCTYCKGTGDVRNSQYGWINSVCKSCGGNAVCEKCINGIVVCKTCAGQGTVTGGSSSPTSGTVNPTNPTKAGTKCSTCGDSGRCRHCDGMGMCSNENCFNGREKCGSCYGTGDCEYCYGLGHSSVDDIDCSHCNDGECRRCSGKGEWKCTTCNGTGDCSHCEYGYCPACGG